MHNLAQKLEPGSVFQEIGTIVLAEGAHFVVRTTSGDFRARKAVSCLVEPMVSDRVLLTGVPEDICYVLAVLERQDDVPMRIELDGDLQINLPHGRCGIAAQEGVDLAAAKEVSITAGGIRMSAAEGHLVLGSLSLLGSVVHAEVERIKVFAESCESVLERMVQRVKRSYRFIAESDQVRAERIDYTAKETMSLHAKNTLVTSEELVKFDGEQIHLG